MEKVYVYRGTARVFSQTSSPRGGGFDYEADFFRPKNGTRLVFSWPKSDLLDREIEVVEVDRREITIRLCGNSQILFLQRDHRHTYFYHHNYGY